MIFPPAASLFWGFAVLFFMLGNIAMLAFCGIVVLIDSLFRWAKIRLRKIPIEFTPIFLAVPRSYFAFFYHSCTFVSRYYLIWCIFIAPLSPLASATILGMHLIAGIVEYFIKKPRLNAGSYLFYFSLDQLSYQLGVWWGCLKMFNFNPVNPEIVTKSLSKEKQ